MLLLHAAWPLSPAARLVITQSLCVTAVVVAWRQTAAHAAVGDHRSWLYLAVMAAVVSGLANVLFLLQLRRLNGMRSYALLHELDAAASAPRRPEVRRPSEDRVSVEGLTLVHRPSCALVRGRAVVPAGSGEPCGWCRP